MRDICVKVDKLYKRFLIIKNRPTVLRTLKALIKSESLRKEFWVLNGISFEVKKGEKLAIIGKNGSGKTTLLRILTGIYEKTSGFLKVECQPRALFNFWIGFNSELSVIDNIHLFGAIHGIKRDILSSRTSNILEMSELGNLVFCPLKELSLGQQQRLALSVFFQTASDFLIFDESLAFVDQSFAQKCEDYFQKIFIPENTIIMTSNNSSFLRRHCKTALWLDEGRIRAHGEVGAVLAEYESFLGAKNKIE